MGMAPPFRVRCLRFCSIKILRSGRMSKLPEYVWNKLRVAESSLTYEFRWRFSAALETAQITPSGIDVKIAFVILLSGEYKRILIMCLTYFNSLRTLFDFDLLINLIRKFIVWQWSRSFIHCLSVAIHCRQLSEKDICPESKYGIGLRTVVNHQIPVRFYGVIWIGIYKPLRVCRQELSCHCPKLTVVS